MVKGGDNLNKKMLLISILIVLISVNFVSAEDNTTNSPTVSDVILNTSDMDLLGDNLVYNASVNSLNNASLENQTVIFCVNGINYTKLTDVNGNAFLNITLNNGIYPIYTTFIDANNDKIVNNNTIYVSNVEGTLIKDNLSGSEIQKIIDDANDGDTLIFAGSNYNDVSVNVNKSLNIISIVKSTFKGNNNNPVIKVTADNVNISDLVISSASIGILIDNANNAAVSSNSIVNSDEGICVLNSNDTLIFNNNISKSNRGIYLKNSLNTNISYNNLLNNYDGIYFDSDVRETQIYSNYISKSQNNAVNFAKSGANTNMTYNILERNENGVFVDMDGDDNLNIEYNTIQRNNVNGIYFGENYRKTNESNTLNIGNNSIVYNTEFNILARDSIYTSINLNKNWIASDNPRFDGVCSKVKFPKYHLNVNQIDGNTLFVSVDGIKASTVLKVSYNGGKNWQSVNLVNGQASLAVSNGDGKVMFDYFEENTNYQYQLEDYVAPVPENPVEPSDSADPVEPVTPITPETNDSPQSNGNGTDSRSEKIEGNGTATNPNSGSPQGQSVTNVDNSNNAIEEVSSQSSESSSSQPASQAVSSTSNPQSVSKQVSDPSESIAKVLNVDEEVVRIAGMGFILLLIIAVIAVYYRDDVKYMLNRRNGH